MQCPRVLWPWQYVNTGNTRTIRCKGYKKNSINGKNINVLVRNVNQQCSIFTNTFSHRGVHMKVFIVPIKKLRHTIQMTNDRLIHRLNYQWQPSLHFSWPIVGQYDVILYRNYKKHSKQFWHTRCGFYLA